MSEFVNAFEGPLNVASFLRHAEEEQRKATEAANETMWTQAEMALEQALKALTGTKNIAGPLTALEVLGDATAHLALFTGLTFNEIYFISINAAIEAIKAGDKVVPFDEPTFWRVYEAAVVEKGGKECLTY